MNSTANVALVIVVVIYVVARQFRPRQIGGDVRRMLVIPAVLAFLAFKDGHLLDPAHQATSGTLLVVSILLEVGMGFAWGFSTRIWRDAAGTVWYKGTRTTAFAWIGMLLVRGLLYAVGSALGVATGESALLLSVAAVLLVRTAVVTWRAREIGPSYGVPAAN
jgi:predicted neutral ceramidase superfamily lipid hydrolase